MKAEQLTIKAHVRMTHYARACVRLAGWLAPHNLAAARFVIRQAWVWVKLDGGHWTAHNVGAYIDWQHKGN
jgi:hypothetical protein